MAEATMRTLQTKKGMLVRTHLSDPEAISLVGALRTNKFGQELIHKLRASGSLSSDQLAWVHRIALEAIGKGHQVSINNHDAINLKAIYDLIGRGHNVGTTDTVLQIIIADGRALFIGPKNGTTPLQAQIRGGRWAGGSYYGRIDHLGTFYQARECDDMIVTFLKELALMPAQVIGDAGRSSGLCPLCGQELATATAAAYGYGQACAVRFLLPWIEL